ncbi:hypothetical protein PMAYCL1PPCAC_17233, partial [Pristionchus mayeri]
AIFDISYVIVFFVFEIPQDWPGMYEYLLSLNGTRWVQLYLAYIFTCVNGQVLGITLNSLGRVVTIRSSIILQSVDRLSHVKVAIVHFTPPIIFGLFVFFGETPSRFEFLPSVNRMMRVTDPEYVRINSIVCTTASTSGALISSICYVLIFRTLSRRPFRSWKKEVSVLVTSFILFLCLCSVAVYFLCNGLFSVINRDAMFFLRKHTYAFSFPISLLNPWCLLLTSVDIRRDVLGKIVSRTTVVRFVPSDSTPQRVNSTV